MSLLRLSRQLGAVLSQSVSSTSQSCLGLGVNTAKPTVLSTHQSNIFMRCYHSLRSVAGLSSMTNVCGSSKSLLQKVIDWQISSQRPITLEYMHRKGLYKKVRRKRKSPLEGNPQLKGVVLKTLIKKPRKPNSANRKCVRLRLSTGKEAIAYVPGEGHNLQEHNIVLVQGGRLQDTPGVKLVCIRGKYDLPHVKKK